MSSDERQEFFLDTTFLLPFFQIDIAVENFTIESFAYFIRTASRIHFSELSVYEAKAKIHRLAKRNQAFSQSLSDFGDNLTVLRDDEKFVFRSFSKLADHYFNSLIETFPKLNSFDAILLSQASNVGLIITEDQELLALRENDDFLKNATLGKVRIKRWKERTTGQTP